MSVLYFSRVLLMFEALNFLMKWVHENMNPTMCDDRAGAEYLAEECLCDAKRAGFEEADLIKAVRRDLVSFMLSHLNLAVAKAQRASSKSAAKNLKVG
jgi:hypothetical protein